MRREFWDTFLLATVKGTSAKGGVYALGVGQGARYALTGRQFCGTRWFPTWIAPDGSVFSPTGTRVGQRQQGRLYRAYLPDVIASPVMKQTAKLLADMTNRSEKMLVDCLGFPDAPRAAGGPV